ncbi:hypothetical protein STCU_10193 [Strigomonas culicis]|uniref:Secreted protein n=1 Tax=Strigomonas culicis TaxID=28005 RepID=S9TMZ9_9TRYP|nr:hypothetical protein STCU_10193 [Strigomonas culicis]|eukprot:EPY18099.1 hypothetical protein STCU_10193 [Strigomonas culicis]
MWLLGLLLAAWLKVQLLLALVVGLPSLQRVAQQLPGLVQVVDPHSGGVQRPIQRRIHRSRAAPPLALRVRQVKGKCA